jgi:CheY-like chemotaxis protein
LIQTVLLAEDDDMLREAVAWCLLARGYRVVTAGNGYEAVEAMLSTKIDLLLLDIGLPCVDGHHVLRRMKEDPVLNKIPVLVATGTPKEVPRSVPTLAKPFSDEQLLTVVETAIGPPYRRPPTPLRVVVAEASVNSEKSDGNYRPRSRVGS